MDVRTRASEPRPRRVHKLSGGLSSPPPSSFSASSPPASPPLLPVRSPLRITPRGSLSNSDLREAAAMSTSVPEPSVLKRASFAHMNGLIEALSAANSWAPDDKTLSILSDINLTVPLSPPYDLERSPTSATLHDVPIPKVSKRVHALLELLSSERAYASDLALMRDIHIPMATGQPAPIYVGLPTPPTSSGSSARTLSTASDASSASALGPPMSREDVKVVFGNLAELAVFADGLCSRIEEALGSVLDGGSGEDRIGALFLEIIPSMEPKYKTYITRHPDAIAHLAKLPQTPALAAYLTQTQTLASSLTHAWDLQSFLIKPVQRLLKYPLLLGAIAADTPDSHLDKPKLVRAKDKLEEVARGVNEGRRRYEVVREVLAAGHKPKEGAEVGDPMSKSKWKQGKKGMAVPISVAASVNLGRLKTLRSLKPQEGHEETAAVDKWERTLRETHTFMEELARDGGAWTTAMHDMVRGLRSWATSFGKVIGLTDDQESEAFDAFHILLDKQLIPLCESLERAVREELVPQLVRLKDSSAAPLRLLEALHTLEPLHHGLLNLNFSKNRPPPTLLEASQSYLALRGQLAAELPLYVGLLKKGVHAAVGRLARWQAQFWGDVRVRWSELWDALRVDGEMNAGAEETMKVWWTRWEEIDQAIKCLAITNGKKVYVEPANKRQIVDPPMTKRKQSIPRDQKPIPAALSSLDSSYTTSPSAASFQTLPISPAPPYTTSPRPSYQSAWSETQRRALGRRLSNDSLRSARSGKSGKSGKSQGVDDHALAPLQTGVRTKSMPIAPRRSAPASTSRSHGDRSMGPPSPSIADYAAGALGSSSHSVSYEPEVVERGRRPEGVVRKPSFRRKMSGTLDSLRPGSTRGAGRSSSRTRTRDGGPPSPGAFPLGFDFATLGIPGIPGAVLRTPGGGRARSGSNPVPRAHPPLYMCRVVHPCEPPDGVEYRRLPFFTLRQGDMFDVIREAGHPSQHEGLPLYVDDGDDCLLLVRDRTGQLGWALASFMVPAD